MALLNPDPIFRGQSTGGVRKAYRILIETKWDREKCDHFLFPCVASFGMAETAIKAGVDPKICQTSDISLYSSVLGYVFDPTKDPRDLDVTIDCDELNEILHDLSEGSDEEYAAKLLMAIQLTQMESDRDWRVWQRREMVSQKEAVHAQMVAGLTKMNAGIGGLSYEVRDAIEHISEYKDDPRAWIWYNPPMFKGDYAQMFDTKGRYTWGTQPDIAQLYLETTADFVDELLDSPIVCTLGAENWYPIDSFQAGRWYKVYGGLHNKLKRKVFLCINKPEYVDQKPMVERPKMKKLPAHVPPVYDDHEITQKSKIELLFTDETTALYFYDLFIKELGMTSADSYYLFLIDKQVAGVVGLQLSNFIVQRVPTVYEIFGICMTASKYLRLSRLRTKLLTCREFGDQIKREGITDNLMLPQLETYQYACQSKYPTNMQSRGIAKLKDRKKLKNGRWHLKYHTPFHQMPPKEVLKQWLHKHAKHQRGVEGAKE